MSLFIGLTACQSVPVIQWQPAQVSTANAAKAWELKGKIAVKMPDDSFSTNLYWLHTPTSDELRLTSMLGTSLMTLISQKDKAILEVDGKTYKDDNPQALLDKLSRIDIPLTALPKWILGLKSKETDQFITNDKNQLLSIIDTSVTPQWQVNYLTWQQQSGTTIPRLIKLNRDQIELKIQLTQWQALTAVTSSELNDDN